MSSYPFSSTVGLIIKRPFIACAEIEMGKVVSKSALAVLVWVAVECTRLPVGMKRVKDGVCEV